jgi:hypothetical protein
MVYLIIIFGFVNGFGTPNIAQTQIIDFGKRIEGCQETAKQTQEIQGVISATCVGVLK